MKSYFKILVQFCKIDYVFHVVNSRNLCNKAYFYVKPEANSYFIRKFVAKKQVFYFWLFG